MSVWKLVELRKYFGAIVWCVNQKVVVAKCDTSVYNWLTAIMCEVWCEILLCDYPAEVTYVSDWVVDVCGEIDDDSESYGANEVPKEVHTIEHHVQVYSNLESFVKVVKRKESNCKWQRCPGIVHGKECPVTICQEDCPGMIEEFEDE